MNFAIFLQDNQTPPYKNYKERHLLFWDCYIYFPFVLCFPATLQFFHSLISHGTPSENQTLGRKPSSCSLGTCSQAWAHPMLISSHLVLLSWTTLLLKPVPHGTVFIHGFLKQLFVYMCSSTHFMAGFQKNLKTSKCICLYLIKLPYLLFSNDLDKNNQKGRDDFFFSAYSV